MALVEIASLPTMKNGIGSLLKGSGLGPGTPNSVLSRLLFKVDSLKTDASPALLFVPTSKYVMHSLHQPLPTKVCSDSLTSCSILILGWVLLFECACHLLHQCNLEGSTRYKTV